MLTKHKYKPLGTGWDKDKIIDCCKSVTTEDPKCGDCCYDTWSDELKQVTKKYQAKSVEASQLDRRITCHSDRLNEFKKWLSEMDTAQKNAKAICHQLELIATQSEKIWSNAQLGVKAIEILFCMIKDFFLKLDYLKKRYEELKLCISKNTDPVLVSGQGLLKCITDYGVKLDALIALKEDIFKTVIDAVRLSNLLRNDISTRDFPFEYIPCKTNYDPCHHHHKPCPDCNDEEISYGFKTIICEWYRFFNCEEPCECDDKNNQGQKVKPKTNNGPATQGKDDCSNDCYLETFSFPICNDGYRLCIKERYDRDDQSVKDLQKEKKEVDKAAAALLACQSSLDAAKKAVDPKARC